MAASSGTTNHHRHQKCRSCTDPSWAGTHKTRASRCHLHDIIGREDTGRRLDGHARGSIGCGRAARMERIYRCQRRGCVRRAGNPGGRRGSSRPGRYPGVGRFAVAADPQGAVFALFKGDGDPPPLPPAGTPGQHQAGTNCGPANGRARSRFIRACSAGPRTRPSIWRDGIYQTFAVGWRADRWHDDESRRDAETALAILFNVAEIEAAAARVRDAGGAGPGRTHQVPGGSWIVHCSDPQSAIVALVGPKG